MVVSRDAFTDLLRSTVQQIDIPDYVYEDATVKYEDGGEWLAQEDSELHSYSPQIYPQGSFRLGTVIQPVSSACEYDIDLVCLIDIKKENTTQEKLKSLVGSRLRKRRDLAHILEERRRCWTLTYPRQFHLDVLPSIPNLEAPPTGILLSDRELRNWQKSNPIGYADWFYARMRNIFDERRALVAKSLNVNVEDVPRWAVKTPLQRSVQLLKRHRDILFQRDVENQPISIIITTLAAQVYRSQPDIYTAIRDIVEAIAYDLSSQTPKFIQKRNGRWWIQNPVDDENFADKWNEYPERAKAFMVWIQRMRADLASAERSPTLHDAQKRLAPVFGTSTGSLEIKGSSRTALSVLSPAEVAHCKPPEWPVHQVHTATVIGTAHLKKGGPRLWTITERELPKHLSLKFIVRTNATAPYTVRWQVVNTGREAAEARGLRGDFYSSDDAGTVRWESTLYSGTHWIEAFIIKDGMCVARSGRKYVRIR